MSTITLDFETTAPTVTDEELEQLALDALTADISAKEAAERQKVAKDAFKKALEERGQLNGDYKGVGVVRTIIKPSRRFDAALAKTLLTEEEIEKFSTKTLDSKLIQRNVSPDVYELMQKSSGWSLEVKVAD
jgi:hypothetical protein